MKTNMNQTNTLTKLTEIKGNSLFQVLEFDELRGGKDVRTAFMLSFMRQAGIKLRQLRIVLSSSGAYIESGRLSFMRGPIEVSSNTGGLFSFSKQLITSKITGENLVRPLFKGTGELLLEPSFGHIALLELENESVIIDDTLFFAAEQQVEMSTTTVKTVSGALLGNEGFFQTKLSGTGIVALELPVPEQEIFKYKLVNDILKVDGNFAILRTGTIEFSVEKTTKSLMGSALSGEGFMNVFKGTGEVWLMPTKSVYDELLKTVDNPMMRPHAEHVAESKDGKEGKA